MGTVFQVPWTRIDPWPAGVATLQQAGFTVATLALADDAVSLDELAADPPERLALVLGTEGDGLSHHTLTAADLTVTIPMAGGVDSLNVAAAGAVAAWALRPAGERPPGAATSGASVDEAAEQRRQLGRGVGGQPAVHRSRLDDRRPGGAEPAEAPSEAHRGPAGRRRSHRGIPGTPSRARRRPRPGPPTGRSARSRSSSTR